MLVSLLDSRPISAARRLFGHFGVRLAMSVILALGLAEGLTYATVSQNLERQQIQSAAALHHADAASIIRAASRYAAPTEQLREVTEQLQGFSGRSGTLEAILVDRNFRIVAAADESAVGRKDHTPKLADALRTGHAWVGHEQRLHGDHRDFEFIRPIAIRGTTYAFEIASDGEVFDAQLSSIRHEMLVAGALALLGAALLFWLAGGRRVLRMHRFALERATRDGLTDLLNHRAFQDALQQAGEAAARYGEEVALVLIDLDAFKAENDRHGHRHGDDRLKAAAQALVSGRTNDRAFRIGGDEFAVLLTHTDTAGARRASNRLRKRFAEQQIVASIGVGVLRPGQSPYDLREEVDAALYEAKRAGGDRIVVFDDIADAVSVITGKRRDALSRLIADKAIEVAFQPIWDLPNDRVIGVEALARPHPEYGFTGPAEAFDTAHQLGSVRALDRLCVERILAQAGELSDDLLLFINLSPKTLELDTHDSHWFIDCVAAADREPASIVIEVTERMGSRTRSVTESVHRLRRHGFHVAIDDMGTGNSGLEMLRELEPEYVKLDRSVVVGALTDPNARGVLMGVTAFAHETGAFVIAEGIEDDEILDFVNTLPTRTGSPQIDGGQGYGLGRPELQLPKPAPIAPVS